MENSIWTLETRREAKSGELRNDKENYRSVGLVESWIAMIEVVYTSTYGNSQLDCIKENPQFLIAVFAKLACRILEKTNPLFIIKRLFQAWSTKC